MNVFKSTGMIDVVANVVMSGGFLPKTTITTIRKSDLLRIALSFFLKIISGFFDC